jgi:DNA-binding LytR/AlgR family response regulator
MRVIIVEDERLASKRLIRMLQQLRPDTEIIAELASLKEAEEFFTTFNGLKTDVLFFDIQLGDGQSFELFEKFKIQGILVFTTAYDQYALKAFKVKATDYLLKPIKLDELEMLLQRIDELIISEPVSTAIEPVMDIQDNKSLRFLVKIGKSLKIITQEDIAYFYSDNKLSLIVSWTGKKFPLDQSLNKIEETAPTDLFFRLNRKLLVHIKSIEEMQMHSKSRIRVFLKPALGEEIIVSSEKSGKFKKWLGDQ